VAWTCKRKLALEHENFKWMWPRTPRQALNNPLNAFERSWTRAVKHVSSAPFPWKNTTHKSTFEKQNSCSVFRNALSITQVTMVRGLIVHPACLVLKKQFSFCEQAKRMHMTHASLRHYEWGRHPLPMPNLRSFVQRASCSAWKWTIKTCNLELFYGWNRRLQTGLCATSYESRGKSQNPTRK